MRLSFLLVTVILISVVARAHEPQPSSSAKPASSSEDAAAAAAPLPVSLDRIREALARAPAKPLLSGLERQPDFKIQIEERRTIEQILEKLDFKTGPAPPGGIYGYEQQQRLFNPVDRPLMQPYAAFSGGELLTIAIENLVLKYLGGRVLHAVSTAERERAEEAARAEVARAIAAYCAAQPVGGAALKICTNTGAPQ
jgi:hypothetical protein